jgi:diguanylate cyclase (GGDEF)-like protein/putative nucleotidyltransferase with HDIG domain
VRGVSITAVVVFGLLMVTAMVLGSRTEHHVESTREAGHAARAFGSVNGLVQAQEIAANDYPNNPDARFTFKSNTAPIRANLADLRRDPDVESDAGNVSRVYDQFLMAARRYFKLVDSGQLAPAEKVDRLEVEPTQGLLSAIATATTTRNAAAADETNNKLEDASETMLVVLPIAFVLAGCILFVLARAGRRSQRAEAEARAEVKLLEHAALTDSLTGLRNHRAFEEDLAGALGEAGRTNSPLCLVSIDVDGLKKVNDSLGHQVGDRRLRQVSAALLAATTPSDGAYRVGGDEFALLLQGAGAWTGFSAGERVRGELNAAEADVDVAAGVAEASPLEGKFDLVRHADLALINAKRTHRQVIVYSPELEGSIEGEVVPANEHQVQVLSTALARAVDAKDAYTRSHSETVSNLCVMIGSELGLKPERIAQLRTAGLLHDVGKIGTPDAILNKPGSLTVGEYETIKEHPVLGEGILRAADLDEESRWVRSHHERPDGAGYPDGLSGDEVPLESRIIGVADAFEAMISDRPYREGRSEREALKELEDFSGIQFDPDCVATLRAALRVSPKPAGSSSLGVVADQVEDGQGQQYVERQAGEGGRVVAG